jgi:glyoxylase-like metal-dependent hydrolase (beta-lactamase superfamily II)
MATDLVRIPIGFVNAYLLRARGTVLVDPGGPPGGAGFRRIVPHLGTPPCIDLIVISHAHFDHVHAAGPLREATGAPVAIHRDDASALREGWAPLPPGCTPWGRALHAISGAFSTRFRFPPLEPDILVDDDGLDLEPFGVTARVVHTPGHTPGSVSVVLPCGDAIVGDLVMNGMPLCLAPSFGVFAREPSQMVSSWQRLLTLGAHTVHPGHGRAVPVRALGVDTSRPI